MNSEYGPGRILNFFLDPDLELFVSETATNAVVQKSLANCSFKSDNNCSGLWVRIHFMRIRIQQFFWLRIQVQLNQIWRKKSWRVFLSCESKTQWSLCKFTFKNLINLHFFCFSWMRIRIQKEKWIADPDPQPCLFILRFLMFRIHKLDSCCCVQESAVRLLTEATEQYLEESF